MTANEKLFDLQCGEAREALSAMLDGAVDGAEEAAVRRHLEHCISCSAYELSLHELDAQMHHHLTGRCDEDAIWARVQAGMEAYGDAPQPRPATAPRRSLAGSVSRWAAAAVVVIGLALGGWQLLWSGEADPSILAATKQDFIKFQSNGGVLDLAAAHPDAVLSWMAARVDFSLPERLAGPAGLKIAGGRLCSFLDRKLAFFSFSAASEDVGLYVTSAEGLEVPARDSLVAVAHDDGLAAVSWYSDGLAYVAVSSLPVGDLTALAEQFRQPGAPRS